MKLRQRAALAHIPKIHDHYHTPYHDPTGDLMAYRQFCLIAEKIEGDLGLLEIPLTNITTWLANGHWAVRELDQWKGWILAAQQTSAGLQRLLDLLRDDREEARNW